MDRAHLPDTRRESPQERAARFARADYIVRAEFAQFDRVRNQGGRADCQDDWPTFHQMRLSQFLTWPQALLDSYAQDLEAASRSGRNLLTEKYGRMMASTEPDHYAAHIAPALPHLSAPRVADQERIIARQVAWAADFMAEFPRLGAGMRRLRTAQDTVEETSFETYLRGELGTYSDATLALYGALVDQFAASGRNLTRETVGYTVVMAGRESLADAEARQAP